MALEKSGGENSQNKINKENQKMCEHLYISESDMRFVLDKAVQREMKQATINDQKISFQHLQSAALSVGISEQALSESYQLLKQERAAKKRRRIKALSAITFVLCLFLIQWFVRQPRDYDDPVKVIFAHKLKKDNYPLREGQRFGLNQEKIYVFVHWLALSVGKYDVSYSWKGPDDQLIYFYRHSISTTSTSYYSWNWYSPKENDPVGLWHVEIEIDNQRLGKFPFLMEQQLPEDVLEQETLFPYDGRFRVVFTDDIDNFDSTDKFGKDQFSLGQEVYAYVTWFDLNGKYTVKYHWLDEEHDLMRLGKLTINPDSPTWHSWSRFIPQQSGKYYVKIFIDDAFVSLESFTVHE